MTPQQFERHKQETKLTFTLVYSKLIPFEKSFCDEYGTYNIFNRDYYLKSNGKKCYVDTFVKEMNFERSKLAPSNNGYSFRVKNEFINQLNK